MAVSILFPQQPPPKWVFERNCVWFPAIQGETHLSCLATIELLQERFDAQSLSADAGMKAFELHQQRIRELAAAQIVEGRLSDDREVLLKTDTFLFKDTLFSDRIRQIPYYFRLCRQLTGELEEVMGVSARFATVEWDRTQDALERDLYILQVRDFTGRTSVAFTPFDLEHDRYTRGRLYRLWGDLLQTRSHRELQELLSHQEGGDAN